MSELTIGSLADEAGVNVETIRYYQRRGLMPEPDKPATHKLGTNSNVGGTGSATATMTTSVKPAVSPQKIFLFIFSGPLRAASDYNSSTSFIAGNSAGKSKRR